MTDIPHVILIDPNYVRDTQVNIEPHNTEDFNHDDNWYDFSGPVFIGIKKGPVSDDELIAIATMLNIHQDTLTVKPITELIEFDQGDILANN